MAVEMRLYRVTVVGSNAERQRGKVVDEVTVKVGTKWLTDDNGRRYYKVPLEDANRIYIQTKLHWNTHSSPSGWARNPNHAESLYVKLEHFPLHLSQFQDDASWRKLHRLFRKKDNKAEVLQL